jgi:hypothetical protein
MSAVLEQSIDIPWMSTAREASPENAEATATVLELASAWSLGGLPLAGVRTACTGYDRFVAVNHTVGPDKDLVLSLLDALIDTQNEREGSVMTHHGRFTQADLHEYGGLLLHRNGRRVLVWPSLSNEGRWVYGAERVGQ